jgi:hypothetical protein
MTGIYYADLFMINGVGCIIMGYGKTKACMSIVGDTTKMIMLDSIRLDYKDGILWGYGDASMGILPKDKLSPPIEVKYFVYMESEEETNNNHINMTSINMFCEKAKLNIIMGCDDIKARETEFRDLIKRSSALCVEVPWCVDHATKGRLLKAFIK